MTIEEIKSKCEEICAKEGVKVDVPVVLNGRLRNVAGRVCYKWIDESCTQMDVKDIEFSKLYVTNADEKDVVATIIHECTHYILFRLTRQRHNHDKVFKELNKKLGGDGSIYIENMDSVVPPKYIVRCSKCGKITNRYYRAGKVVKYSEYYRSNCCNAPIEVEQMY